MHYSNVAPHSIHLVYVMKGVNRMSGLVEMIPSLRLIGFE